MEKKFIEFLTSLAEKEDRAALAHLRRGLGKKPGTAVEMFPIIAPRLYRGLSRKAEDACYLVAALFAFHPVHNNSLKSLGETMRMVADLLKEKKDDSIPQSIERRFGALLDSDAEQLPSRLRQVISMARAKGAPVNYETLLRDIVRWDNPEKHVQRRWASDFWSAGPESADVSSDNISESREE